MLKTVYWITLVVQLLAIGANIYMLEIAKASLRWRNAWATILVVNVMLIARRVVLLALTYDLIMTPLEKEIEFYVGQVIVPIATSVGLFAFSFQMFLLFRDYKEILIGGSKQN